MRLALVTMTLVVTIALAQLAWAQQTQPADFMLNPAAAPAAASQPAGGPASQISVPPAGTSVTEHSILLNGKPLRYTATAGYIPLTEEGKTKASIFYVAYVKQNEAPEHRPITFVFNGGPGASSMYLHVGALGPKRVLLPDEGLTLPKFPRLEDNEYTWLSSTDLVFVDPVGTGFSMAAPGVDPKPYFDTQGDIQSLGEFIRLYVAKSGRWMSPKFLAGESYGATRSAGIANYLQKDCAMYLDGVVLISSALNFQAIAFAKENDLPYVLFLPTYTAVAWYHNKVAPDLQADLGKTLAEAEQWALDEYAPALSRGSDLPAEQRKKIVQSLHRFTGLSAEYIEQSNLRISTRAFAKQLLSDEGRLVGILDGRVKGFPIDPPDNATRWDPSLVLVAGPYAAAIQDYLRKDLKFQTDLQYQFLSPKVAGAWNFGAASDGFCNTTGDLQQAMTKNYNLKVFAAVGDFDLTTGYFGQIYILNHLGLPPALQHNVQVVRYLSGHQLYTDKDSLKKFTADVAAFYKACESASASVPSSDADGQ